MPESRRRRNRFAAMATGGGIGLGAASRSDLQSIYQRLRELGVEKLSSVKSAVDPTAAYRQLILQAVLSAGLGGLGVGAAARSAMGLHDFLRRRFSDVPATSSVPTTLPVPVLPETLPDAEATGDEDMGPIGRNRLRKAAQDPVPQEPAPFYHPLASNVGAPLGVAAGTGGLYAGWKFVDWLLQQRKQSRLTQELQDAQAEFEDSLRQGAASKLQTTQPRIKQAAEQPGQLSADLDRLYDKLEKQASGWGSLGPLTPGGTVWPSLDQIGGTIGGAIKGTGKALGDWWHGRAPSVEPSGPLAHGEALSQAALGTYLTLAMLAAGGAGLTTYNFARGMQKDKLLEEAVKLRARQRMSPQPLYAVPTVLPGYRKP